MALDLSSLGVRIALNADSLTRTFACACIRLRALTTNGEATAMPDSAIAVNGGQPLEMRLLLATKVTFSDEFHGLDHLNDHSDLLVREFARSDVRIDIASGEDFSTEGKTDAINIRQRVFDLLFVGDIDSEETSHDEVAIALVTKIRLTLALFVARIFADDTDNTLAANDSASFTKGLNRWANSHDYEEDISTAFLSAAGGESTGVP